MGSSVRAIAEVTEYEPAGGAGSELKDQSRLPHKKRLKVGQGWSGRAWSDRARARAQSWRVSFKGPIRVP